MDNYQEVFKRTEQKYLLDANTYMKLRKHLEPYAQVDSYGKTTVCNIYYDTPDRLLVKRSAEKPFYKEKFRVRSYGTPTKDSPVFVELKKKYDGVVYKRRVQMTLEQSQRFISEGICTGINPQIENELSYCFTLYRGLAPAMFLSYDRIAMFGVEDESVRITFDSNITYRENMLDLSTGVWGKKLLEKGDRIMEIKIAGAMPLWLVRILDKLCIYPVSFSKYGAAYLNELKLGNERKEGVICA